MYTEYYGLNTQPFRLTPDPFFFFNSTTHKSALAYLRYGMQLGEGFIVVTGAAGTGKTTLSLALLGSLSRSDMVIGELVTTQLQDEDLLRSIASAFKLDSRGTKAELIRCLQDFFSARVRGGKKVLLVVDEAHNLPQISFEELRMLSNFHRGPHALLQCILLGQQPLRDILAQSNMEQLQQRVIASHHLYPLSAIETREYILHRLQQAGWRGDPGFTAESVHRIYQYTQGIPRLINMFCNRILLFGYIEEKHQIDAGATIQVYNEWKHEFGHIGSVESAQQAQFSEINTAGITQEHVTLRRAVGADSPSYSKPSSAGDNKVVAMSRPDVRDHNSGNNSSTVVRHDGSVTSPSMDKFVGMVINRHGVDNYHTALSDRIFENILRLFSEKNTTSAPFPPALSVKSTLIIPLAVLVLALLIMTMLFPVNNSGPEISSTRGGDQISGKADQSSEELKWTKSFESVKPGLPVLADEQAQVQESTQQPDQHDVSTAGIKNTLPITLNMTKENTVLPQEKSLQKINTKKKTESEFSALITEPENSLIDKTVENNANTKNDVNLREQHNNITVMDLKEKGKVKPEPKSIVHNKNPTHKGKKVVKKAGSAVIVSKKVKSLSSGPAGLTRSGTKNNMIENSPKMVKNTDAKVLHEADISNRHDKNEPAIKSKTTLVTITPQTSPAETPKGLSAGLPEQPASGEAKASVVSSATNTKKIAEHSNRLPISEERLLSLMDIFRWAYDVGDLDTLVELFSSDVHSDEGVNRQDIENSYQRLFNVTDERHLVLNDLQWSSAGDAVRGEGKFTVSVKERGRNWVSSYRGKITLRVVKHDNQLLITVLHHNYTR